ncbi:GNAT family N-acetyltransferase [Solitalea koreensis]|uniref:Acetyltransferase (GNAT) family protein n=1 Tax=Solitalea koreensis TaxID=543615 RepID=A0A521DPA5_9SPHI|nr:GNAT family N-acetyltransferase [Solitalea koreensis]SMO73432.1 Acetyltransferase (GNAT) family protein [Solitalea koreensis]
MESRVKIIDYQPEHQPHFEALNKSWIVKYFHLEPIDKAVLEHPKEHIYDHGGLIIMAQYDGKIVGTVALKRIDEHSLEMTKMAVDENYQGFKIGLKLGEAILQKARDLKARKVILYSNRKLVPAISLYRKLGFIEVPVEPGKYERCDIKMEIEV